MKKIIPFLLIGLLIAGTSFAKEIFLGEKLTLNKTTKVSEINAHPDTYQGKRVRVEGVIIDVCAARGCWMDISSDVPFDKIQIKVIDGEIVFPLEAKGQTAIVEGIVEKLELSYEQALRYERHRAQEQGKEFDPSKVKGPVALYRIRGLGAVIK